MRMKFNFLYKYRVNDAVTSEDYRWRLAAILSSFYYVFLQTGDFWISFLYPKKNREIEVGFYHCVHIITSLCRITT